MNSTPLAVRIVVWVWLIAALLGGNSGALQRIPLPALLGILAALTGIVLLLYFKVRSLRTWIDRLDLRALVALHVTRFVGLYFILLAQRGELPDEFAVRGGWGDIAVAALALLVCVLPLKPASRQRAINIWNVIGLVDILLVLISATQLGWQNTGQMRALTYLPLSLLPTFLVPLLIATHLILFIRLKTAPAPHET